MCHFTFCSSNGFRLLCRTTTVMNTDDATFNSMQLFLTRFNFLFFMHICEFEKDESCSLCEDIYVYINETKYSGTKKKKIRTEIRSSKRFSANNDGNYQLFSERDIFVFFVYFICNNNKEEEMWSKWDDLLEKAFLYFPDVCVKANPAVFCQSHYVWPSSFTHLTWHSTDDNLFASV